MPDTRENQRTPLQLNHEPDRRVKELAQRAVAGDDESFGELARRHSASLRRFLLNRGVNDAVADDLVQETLIRAHTHIAHYDARYAFSTWLYSIAIRLAASLHRKTEREKEAAAEYFLEHTDVSSGNDSSLFLEEAAQSIWETARKVLSADQFKVLRLRYIENMTTREIASALGMSHVSVRVSLHRARSALANCLAGRAERRREL